MMLKANAVQQRLDLFDSDFAIRRRYGKQLAAGEFFRRATFIDVNVCCLSANDRMMRLRYCFESEHIRARAAEDEKDFYVFAQMLLKLFCGLRGVRVVAIGDDMSVVDGSDRLHHARMNAGVVVTGKAAFRDHSLFQE